MGFTLTSPLLMCQQFSLLFFQNASVIVLVGLFPKEGGSGTRDPTARPAGPTRDGGQIQPGVQLIRQWHSDRAGLQTSQEAKLQVTVKARSYAHQAGPES